MLQRFAAEGDPDFHEGRGDRVLAQGLAAFFMSAPWLPNETPGNAYVYYLDRWLVDAFEAFRTDVGFTSLRKLWKEEMGGHCDEIPDLINLGVSDPVWSSLVGDGIARVLRAITKEEWLYKHIKSYLGAQTDVVMQHFRVFVRVAWRTGLCKTLKESTRSGFGGVFGTTKLLSFCTAGRVMLTFGDAKVGPDVSFVGEDGEAAGARFGLQSCCGGMLEAIRLVDDVVAHWKLEDFKEARDVGFG